MKLANAVLHVDTAHRGASVISNLEAAALQLQLMVEHDIIDLTEVTDEKWSEVPLESLLMDPVFLLTTRTLKGQSPNLSEYVGTGKALGSQRPSEIRALNCDIFNLLQKVSKGKFVGMEVASELLKVLQNEKHRQAVIAHRHFYKPIGIIKSTTWTHRGPRLDVDYPVESEQETRARKAQEACKTQLK
ncbi:hypothetical protein NMY22_g9645 [Coprinellus aureogranulatus]|nr:hypothetical protein NMY22_g9645 [Coprinellus aureogranulatus]